MSRTFAESITAGFATRSDDIVTKSLELLDSNEDLDRCVLHGYSTLLVVGGQCSGKTSIIERFVELCNNEKAAPQQQQQPQQQSSLKQRNNETIALEYRFVRRDNDFRNTSSSLSEIDQLIGKKIANIWELGNGTLFTNLISFAISPATVRRSSIVLVLDLTRPTEMSALLNAFWKAFDSHFETLYRQCGASLKRELADETRFRSNWHTKRQSEIRGTADDSTASGASKSNSIDSSAAFPLPILILGTRYDEFQNFDPEIKKQIVRYLRTVACTRAAQLIFVSNKSETLMRRAYQAMEMLAFERATCFAPSSGGHEQEQPDSGVPIAAADIKQLKQSISSNFAKPVALPFGYDSLNRIGVTSLHEVEQDFVTRFPQQPIEQRNVSSITTDPRTDPNFAEPEIDKILEYKYMLLKPQQK